MIIIIIINGDKTGRQRLSLARSIINNVGVINGESRRVVTKDIAFNLFIIDTKEYDNIVINTDNSL